MRMLKSDLEQIQFCWNSLISMHGRQLSNCEAKNMTDLKAEHEIVFRGCRSRTGWRPKKKKIQKLPKMQCKNGGF